MVLYSWDMENITQAEWTKAISGDRKCAICKSAVESHHTQNLDKDKHLVHDYCLRTEGVR